jgi:subtilase family serine protease
MLAASGDSGAHGRTDESCLFDSKMHPDYPAASPYVTAVGGTQFNYDSMLTTAGASSPICTVLGVAPPSFPHSCGTSSQKR